MSIDNEIDDIYYNQALNTPETKDLPINSINEETVKPLLNEMDKKENNDENNKKSKNYFDVKTVNERGRKRNKIIEGKNRLKNIGKLI